MRRRSPTPDASTDRASASWRRHIAVGLRRTLAVAVLLGTWEAATRTGVEDPFTASSPIAQSQYNAALVSALIVLIAAFVLILFSITGAIERHALRWRAR